MITDVVVVVVVDDDDDDDDDDDAHEHSESYFVNVYGNSIAVSDYSIFSERELKFMFAICRRPSVCRLSVCRLSVVCL